MGQLEDLLGMLQGMGLGGFDFQGMDSTTIFRQIVLKALKDLHAQMGEAIDKLAGPTFDPFSILGVKMDASKEEVTNAYREKAKACHPDKGGSADEMTKLNLAYEVILKLRGWTK